MKKIIFICLLAIIALSSRQTLKAQITLEHTYDATSMNVYGTARDFGILDLGNLNFKYYKLTLDSNFFDLYNLDHSLYTHVPIPAVWNNTNNYGVTYITNSLFDCDSTTVEYILDQLDSGSIKIYRTDGTLLFYADSAMMTIEYGGVGVVNPFIRTTPQGTKMILNYLDGSVKVFSLCGTVPMDYTGIHNNIGNGMSLNNIYPNPSNGNTTIEFNLPQGANTGEIVIYNMQGVELKSYKVDNTFHTLLLNNSEFHAGTYFYQLLTSNGVTGAKKMIVIH
jgi:hypothetical protein